MFRRKSGGRPKHIIGYLSPKPYTPERHEAYLLSIETYDFDADPSTYTYPWLPKIKRYRKQEDGSVWNGYYYYSAGLWEHYVNELRFPDSNHYFMPDSNVEVDVDHTGQSWPRRAMLCTRCGERRDKVSLFVDTNRLDKDGWCVK